MTHTAAPQPAAREIAAITRHPESAPFEAFAARGVLAVPQCKACGRRHWYPRALCPFCFGDVEWQPASGEATVYSYTVMRRAKPPYAIAYVTLAEGPTMMTNLVDCDFARIRIGMPVKVVFQAAQNGVLVPMFRPA